MIRIVRTDLYDEHFREMVVELDRELSARDGGEHVFFAEFNKLEGLLGVVVAFVEGEAVGCGAFKPFSDDEVEIKRMFVRPDNRGRRIAAQVLAELEAWAGEHGYTACVLETGFKQPEAIALYKRSGYEVIPNYGQYAGVTSSVCMKRVIAADLLAP